MGASVSKYIKRSDDSASQTVKEHPETPCKTAIQILDPRSPTEGISRTPIILEEYQLPKPLRVQLLRKHPVADPTWSTQQVTNNPTFQCDSPGSVYSSNRSDVESIEDYLEPAEPSVNVSGFSIWQDKLEELEHKCERSTTPEIMAGIEEIEQILDKEPKEIYSEELVKEMVATTLGKSEKKRKPLSNITSSAGNTPNRFTAKKNMKNADVYDGPENSPLIYADKKMRAQWDQDSTVII